MIDTHESVKSLQEGGFTDKQAESLVRVFKQFFIAFDDKLKGFATREELKQVEERIEHKMEKMELRLTVKLGIMMALSIGMIATLIKIL